MNKSVTIIYASTSGNVEVVCEKVAQVLTENGYAAELHRAEVTEIDIVKDNQLFIFATSTWEHGEINPFFDKLLAAMAETDCAGKRAGYIGLGDFRYEPVLFNVAIDIVKETFEKQGGSQVSKILKINGEPYNLLDTTVKKWTLDFMTAVSG